MIITTVQLAMMVSVSAKQTIINESLLFVSGSFAHRRAALGSCVCPGCCCYCGFKPASASNSWRLIGARRTLGRSPSGRD